MYKEIGSHLPNGLRRSFRSLLEYSGSDMDPDKFSGFVIAFGLGLSLAVSLMVYILFSLSAVLMLLLIPIVYIVFIVINYSILWLSADSKANFVDTILPDALNMMAVNMKSGLTTEKAFLLSARTEFGPLEKEINEAGKKMMSGTSLRESLLSMPKKIKSELFGKTIGLIVEGIEAGGELAKLLEQTAQDIQRTTLIQKEVKASVLMYVIFIFFAAGIGVPVIYGISTNLVEVLSTKFTSFDLPQAATQGGFGISLSPANRGNISIPPGFLVTFSLLSFIITSVFGGLIIGQIKDGKSKAGVKYIPIILILSIVLFFVTKTMLASYLAF